VDQLIGLGDVMTSATTDDGMDIPLDAGEAIEEIAIEDDEIAVVEEMEAPVEVAPFTEEATTVHMQGGLDPAADETFEALSARGAAPEGSMLE
jgi:hypothetical protein